MSRIGLLGGTFDPPHLGHLKLAELALATLELDEVRFLPNAAPPHKAPPQEPKDQPQGQPRLRLLEAALAATGLPFRACGLELERGGVSYTVDTLESLAGQEPGHAWVFLMGSDQLPAFASWKRPERILELAALAVAPRPGHPVSALPELLEGRQRERWSGKAGELIWLPGTELELASRALRAELGRGKVPEGIPPEVMSAILRENQYR